MSGGKIVVTGGREYTDRAIVANALSRVNAFMGIDLLGQGEAPGADLLCKAWAVNNRIATADFPANWEEQCRVTCKPGHRRQVRDKSICPAAGVYRNQDMHDEVNPDLLIAFPGGRGTAHMTEYARKNYTTILQFTGEWVENKAAFKVLPAVVDALFQSL